MRRNALWIGAGFFFIYAGYNALQIQLPVQRPTAGPLTIALSYVAYACAALIVPTHSRRARRWLLGCAGLTFAAWTCAVYLPDWALALLSVCNGAGAGTLWSTEGAWLAALRCQDESTGFASGAVLLCFHAATLVGELAAQQWPMQWLALGSALFGSLLLFCTPGAWLGAKPDEITPQEHAHPLTHIFQLVRSPWLGLLPSIVAFGIASALVWVALPLHLGDALHWGFVLFAATSALAFLLLALMVDRWPALPYGQTGSIMHALLWTYVAVAKTEGFYLLACMAISAIANALLNHAIVYRQTQLGELAPCAFAAQVALYCASYATAATLVPYCESCALWSAVAFALVGGLCWPK
jgi:hypothetical protein